MRIASLERELALMESEFHRELDKLSSAESDTAVFWQGKHAALEKQVFVLEGLVQEQLDWREGQQQREGQGEGEEVRELRGALERAREVGELREREAEELRRQVRGLKEWVSVSTRVGGEAQTSDEVFGEGMARLGNGLQNWVLVNFRRARVGEWFVCLCVCRGAAAVRRRPGLTWSRSLDRRRGRRRRAGAAGAHVRRAGRGRENPSAAVGRVAVACGARV